MMSQIEYTRKPYFRRMVSGENTRDNPEERTAQSEWPGNSGDRVGPYAKDPGIQAKLADEKEREIRAKSFKRTTPATSFADHHIERDGY